MSYRGDDLDLKVPPGRLRGGIGAGDATLWVDETVLACCNNAFDLALAYGAAEVRLAHLVHALTRVDAAVRILEQRAISTARLRHESAALIVNESPVPLTGDRTPPRRSTELEDVLRRAVDAARRRGAAAGVEDVLHALLMGHRADPAVDLLRRMAPELRAESALQAYPAARLELIEDTLRGIHAELAGDRKLLSDLVRDLQREVASQRGDSASLSTALRERLAELERHLRATPQIAEKLQSIDQAVQGTMGEGVRTWTAIEQRLESLETAVRAADLLEPLAKRLALVEQALQERGSDTVRSWVALADRVQSLEKLYQAGSSEAIRQWSTLTQGNAEILKSLAQQQSAPIDGGALAERLELIERTVRSALGDAVRSNTLLADRVGGVERVIGTRNDTQSAMHLDERLRALESALDGRTRETGGRWLELVDRLTSIEGRISGIAQASAGAAPPTAEDITRPVVGYLASVADAAAARDVSHARAMAEIGGRVAALEHVVQANNAAVHAAARVYDRNTDELHEGFMRLSENQHTLASAIGDWRDDSTTELRRIAGSLDRLKAVEARLESLSRYFTAASVRNVPASAETYTPPEKPAAEPKHGTPLPSIAGFRRWLFGSSDVRRATANTDPRWQRLRDEIRTAAERLRKRS
ncbi:MAG: hypothetical protein ACK4TL_09240 [Hyphomicrobiaceae bacterium]